MSTTLQILFVTIFFARNLSLYIIIHNFHILIMIKSHNLTIRLTDLPREGRPTVRHPAKEMPKIDHLIVFAICDLFPISNYLLTI